MENHLGYYQNQIIFPYPILRLSHVTHAYRRHSRPHSFIHLVFTSIFKKRSNIHQFTLSISEDQLIPIMMSATCHSTNYYIPPI